LNEAFLQILLILAYLSIGLISVIFPIYAICVTYLKQEKWETVKERKQRSELLKRKMNELTKNLTDGALNRERTEELQRQLDKYKDELWNIEIRSSSLTAKRAVGATTFGLIIALAGACGGIYAYYLESWVAVYLLIFWASLFVGSTIFQLYRTIRAVEFAALRTARTIEFHAEFESGGTEMQIKLGDEAQIIVDAGTEEDNVENFCMIATFPLELQIIPRGEIRKPGFEISRFKDHACVIIDQDFLPRRITVSFDIMIKPKKIGRYTVPIYFFGKGINEYASTLVIDVVK